MDSAFCTACLADGAPVSRELITRYVCNRLRREYCEMGNAELHRGLAGVLDLISGRAHGDNRRMREGGVLLIN